MGGVCVKKLSVQRPVAGVGELPQVVRQRLVCLLAGLPQLCAHGWRKHRDFCAVPQSDDEMPQAGIVEFEPIKLNEQKVAALFCNVAHDFREDIVVEPLNGIMNDIQQISELLL